MTREQLWTWIEIGTWIGTGIEIGINNEDRQRTWTWI